MKKNEILNLFESFTDSKLQDLISSEKTYVRKRFKEFLSDTTKFSEITEKLKNYDVHNFYYKESYCVLIYPDKNFIDLLKVYNRTLENEIDLNNLVFEISINKDKLNLIDFQEGLPINIRKLGIGYKLYKLVIEKNNYITSNRYCSDDAKNIWYYLMLDQDLFCYTSNLYSGVIHKKYNNLKYILDKIRDLDIYFDDELEEKIKELYGSMDIYKQKS